MEPIYVHARQLPSGDNCNFGLTEIELPSPDEVRSRAERDGIDTGRAFRPDPVHFPELGLIVKWGEDITIVEGQCLWFLRQHLKEEVPVPTIYGWRKHDGQTFLYLEQISGSTMAALWDDLSEEDRFSVCKQLGVMIKSWRRIKQAPKVRGVCQRLLTAAMGLIGIGSSSQSTSNCRLSAFDGQGLRDIMFSDAGVYPAGPFKDTSEFHDAFAKLLGQTTDDTDAVNPRKQHQELEGLRDDVPVVFTHADLDISNILLSKPDDGPARLVSVIDWHQSGWYPEPWEWLKAQSVGGPQSDWVKNYLPLVLEPAPHEYFYAWEYVNMSTI